MKKEILIGAILILALLGGVALYNQQVSSAPEPTGSPVSELLSGEPRELPIAGTVTMVDLGAHSCVPCKMMTPVLEQASMAYGDRAAIVFIDVWEHPDEVDKYRISAIPTQIFYDDKGVERYRHEGFMSTEDLDAMLAQLGVDKGR